MIDDTSVPASGTPAYARGSRAGKDQNGRLSLLASIIALALAMFVLTVFGIGRMPSRAQDAGSAASVPEPQRNADAPVPPSESAVPAG